MRPDAGTTGKKLMIFIAYSPAAHFESYLKAKKTPHKWLFQLSQDGQISELPHIVFAMNLVTIKYVLRRFILACLVLAIQISASHTTLAKLPKSAMV